MRILHITFTLGYGGIETMLVNVANAQKSMGHDVAIIVIEEIVEKKIVDRLHQGVRVYYAHRKHKRDLLALCRINYFVWKEKPNAIHLHSSAAYRLLLCSKYKHITNCTLHDMPNNANTRYIEQIPQRFSISQSVHDALLEFKGVESIVNPNGIIPDFFCVDKVHGNKGVFRIVQVSRLEYEKKGQDILIKACEVLKSKGVKNYHVDFIGDGGSMTYLQQLSKLCGVSDHISFLGTKGQNYIFQHLCDYDLFVQPSRFEGFGLTVAEAMAAKTPVLVASGDGPEEVVDHGRYGCLFEKGNHVDLASKLEDIINNGYDANMTDGACQRVWNIYNIKVTASNYIKQYVKR